VLNSWRIKWLKLDREDLTGVKSIPDYNILTLSDPRCTNRLQLVLGQ